MTLAAELESVDLAYFMHEALREAIAAGEAGELPIGAVVVINNQIVSRGRARHQQTQCQIRHAELNALMDGGLPLWRDHEHAILFTSVEPCPLCLGATVMADVPHIVFALPDRVVQSRQIVETNAYVQRHIRSYHGGVLQAESQAIVARFAPKLLCSISS